MRVRFDQGIVRNPDFRPPVEDPDDLPAIKKRPYLADCRCARDSVIEPCGRMA
jgi:hypothetical protein